MGATHRMSKKSMLSKVSWRSGSVTRRRTSSRTRRRKRRGNFKLSL